MFKIRLFLVILLIYEHIYINYSGTEQLSFGFSVVIFERILLW